MVAGDFARPNGVNEVSWLAAVSSEQNYSRTFAVGEVQVLRPGSAEGVLYGGCLSLLCASLGTPYEIRTEGTILFIEDRAERPYRIDRMLMQLKLAGKFAGVRGILFGEMIDCSEPGALDYTLPQVILRILGGLDVPIVFGLKSGHVSSDALTLPFGVSASIKAEEAAIILRYEAAVQKPKVAVPGRTGL